MAAIGDAWADGAWVEAGWVTGSWVIGGVSDEAQITGGTVLQEADIVTGGEIILIQLTGVTWVTAGPTFDAQRLNILAGLDAASSPALGWNAEVRDKMLAGTVVRTSDTLVTITLTAAALYDLSAIGPETITVTVPASAISGSLPLVATPVIQAVPPGTIPSYGFTSMGDDVSWFSMG